MCAEWTKYQLHQQRNKSEREREGSPTEDSNCYMLAAGSSKSQTAVNIQEKQQESPRPNNM